MSAAGFEAYNYTEEVLKGLHSMGFATPSPLQKKVIPLISTGKGFLCYTQAGIGKRAAYILPVLDKLTRYPNDGTDTLILVPTRELTEYIDQQIEGFAYFTDFTSMPVCSTPDGSGYEQEKRALTKGAEIVVATPDRLYLHLKMGNVNLNNLKHFILNDADRLLDMGLYADIMHISRWIPDNTTAMMFSPSLPTGLKKLSHNLLNHPELINLNIRKPAGKIPQKAFTIFENQKTELLKGTIRSNPEERIIIFTATEARAAKVGEYLKEEDFAPGIITSDLIPDKKRKTIKDFSESSKGILIIPDFFARYIAPSEGDIIVNYDVPMDADDYVFRITRTFPSEKKGLAITFIPPKDQQRFKSIEKQLHKKVFQDHPPQHIGETPVIK